MKKEMLYTVFYKMKEDNSNQQTNISSRRKIPSNWLLLHFHVQQVSLCACCNIFITFVSSQSNLEISLRGSFLFQNFLDLALLTSKISPQNSVTSCLYGTSVGIWYPYCFIWFLVLAAKSDFVVLATISVTTTWYAMDIGKRHLATAPRYLQLMPARWRVSIRVPGLDGCPRGSDAEGSS